MALDIPLTVWTVGRRKIEATDCTGERLMSCRVLLDLFRAQVAIALAGKVPSLKQSAFRCDGAVQIVDIGYRFSCPDEITGKHTIADQACDLAHFGFAVKKILEHF